MSKDRTTVARRCGGVGHGLAPWLRQHAWNVSEQQVVIMEATGKDWAADGDEQGVRDGCGAKGRSAEQLVDWWPQYGQGGR